MKYVHNDSQWAREMERSFEAYLDNCVESVDSDESFETESGEMFCGCSECYTRESIMWLIPRIIDAYRAGVIEEDFSNKSIEERLSEAAVESFEYDVTNVYSQAAKVLLQKHKDYGPKNIAGSPGGPLNGLRVRMWDKIARINHLMDSGAEPENESLRDSFLDLMNYSAIAQLVIEGNWPDE